MMRYTFSNNLVLKLDYRFYSKMVDSILDYIRSVCSVCSVVIMLIIKVNPH